MQYLLSKHLYYSISFHPAVQLHKYGRLNLDYLKNKMMYKFILQ